MILSIARFFMRLIIVSPILILGACANVSMLPISVDEIDFAAPEGKTGWSQYRQVEKFNGYNADQIYSAAKSGLGAVGFSLREADKSAGRIIGEHGITLYDWNIIAGVFFKEQGTDTIVAVLVEGSKDVGFAGDATGDNWTSKIIKAMRDYLHHNEKN